MLRGEVRAPFFPRRCHSITAWRCSHSAEGRYLPFLAQVGCHPPVPLGNGSQPGPPVPPAPVLPSVAGSPLQPPPGTVPRAAAPDPAPPSPALTQVDEAHDHVSFGEEVAVLQAGQRRPLGAEDGLVGVREALAVLGGGPRRPLLHGHGIVKVQHEHGGRVVLAVEVRPRAVRQAEDGEDLPLHLAALGAAQPPVDEAGVHLVVHREVGEHAAQPEGGRGGAQHQQPGGGLPAPRHRHRGAAAAAAGRRGGRGAAPPRDAPRHRHARGAPTDGRTDGRPRAQPPRRRRSPLMARGGGGGGGGCSAAPAHGRGGGGGGPRRFPRRWRWRWRERSAVPASRTPRRSRVSGAARRGAAGGCLWWEEQAAEPKRSLSLARSKALGRENPWNCLEEGGRLLRLLFRMFVEAAGSARG